MGSATSKAANSVGTALGNAIIAPFKASFGASCRDVCAGAWDIACFIEHFCISNILKLLMILVLCYILLMFLYLSFQLGICQCIAKSLCKMSCALCKTYCYALHDVTCFCWYKLKNVKRVNRRRPHPLKDIELGYSSSSDGNISLRNEDQRLRLKRKRKLLREGRQRRARHLRHANTRNQRRCRHNDRRMIHGHVALQIKNRSHSIKRLRNVEAEHEGHHRHTDPCKRRRIT